MRPDAMFDMPPQVASFGRGSPTGVVCYRHTQFPEKYRGALFVLDWSYGRVHALPLQATAETWKTEPELFMTAVGQHGFAPTDAEVAPMVLCMSVSEGAAHAVASTESGTWLDPKSQSNNRPSR
jgi:hypothetical protein